MDQMGMYEAKAIMDYAYYAHKDEWEQARLVAWMVAQVNSKNKLKLSDILAFYWEKESDAETTTAISNRDIDRLRKQAQQYINNNLI